MTTIDQRENSHVFSIMKGLGIIFVVAGHTAYSPVHNFVYLFHLAVFYFVAGYFFKDKYIDDKLLFVWKKIKSLWFPLVGYGIVFMLLHNLFFRAHFYNPLTSHLYTRQDYFDCLKYFCSCVTPEQLLGALWFLRSLFIVSFLFVHDRSLDFQTAVRPIFRYNFRGGGFCSQWSFVLFLMLRYSRLIF